MGVSKQKKWATTLVKATYRNGLIGNKGNKMPEINPQYQKNENMLITYETKKADEKQLPDKKELELFDTKENVIDEINKIELLISECEEKCRNQKDKLIKLGEGSGITQKKKNEILQVKIDNDTQNAFLTCYKKVISNISGEPLKILNNMNVSELNTSMNLSQSLLEIVNNFTVQLQQVLSEINRLNNQIKDDIL
jgi:hypothetical protein